MNPVLQRVLAATLGTLAASFTDGPWRSKSVLTALVIVVVGMGFWANGAIKSSRAKRADTTAVESPDSPSQSGESGFSRPIPGYVRFCASYIGGFCIGWAFRRFLKLAAVILVLGVSLLGFAKFTGWDTTGLRTRMERTATVAQEQVGRERDYLRGLLPSATAGGMGAFFGFRRKRRDAVPAPEADPPA